MPTYKDIMSVLDRNTKNVSVCIDTIKASYGKSGMSEYQARKSVFAEKVAGWEVRKISLIDSILDENVGIYIEIIPPADLSNDSIKKTLSESESFNDKWEAEYYQDEKAIRSKKEEQKREDMNKAVQKLCIEKAFEGNEEFQKAFNEVFKKYWDMYMNKENKIE